MWSSAIASSSPVVTPGRTAAVTAFSAPAVTSPEARISSSSCGVLIWIIRPLHFASTGRRARGVAPRSACTGAGVRSAGCRGPGRCGARAEGGQRATGHLVDLADRVDAAEQTRLLVEPGQRCGLFPVDLQ